MSSHNIEITEWERRVLLKYVNDAIDGTDSLSKVASLSLLKAKIVKKGFEKVKKPPIELRPKWVSDQERLIDVVEAIDRFHSAGFEMPIEWIREYRELVAKVINNPNQ